MDSVHESFRQRSLDLQTQEHCGVEYDKSHDGTTRNTDMPTEETRGIFQEFFSESIRCIQGDRKRRLKKKKKREQ